MQTSEGDIENAANGQNDNSVRAQCILRREGIDGGWLGKPGVWGWGEMMDRGMKMRERNKRGSAEG